MVIKIFLLSLLLASICLGNKNIELNSIEQLNWKNRIILIWNDGDIEKLRDEFSLNDYEIKDRHILWFIIKEKLVYSNFKGKISNSFLDSINTKYYTKNANILLIGKDGQIKDISQELYLKDIYRLIDGMPMRQFEMKRK